MLAINWHHFWHIVGEIAKWTGIGLLGLAVIVVIVFFVAMYSINKEGWH